MQISRRSMLIAASLAAAPSPAWARNLSAGSFTHGIASGDPTRDGFIVWARFAPAPGGDGRIAWEVSESEDFARVARRGHLTAAAANDYCVKADVRGLRAGRVYYYRFLGAGGPSVTGVARTAPSGRAERLSFAFFSCSNKPFGHFHAYGHAAARADIDIALHLGDYIYEYPENVYPSAADSAAGRAIAPLTEIVTYADYCARYASYHDDPDLQELRRLKPMSVIWDDHELANNAYMTGAQNHQPAEGLWADRVAAASKAFFDWMPLRRPDAQSVRIYRSLDWGDLARIVMLDTRYIGRPVELSYEGVVAAAAQGPQAAMAAMGAFQQELNDPARTRMGAAQEGWFAEQVSGSKARGHAWQVIAQQVVTGKQVAAPDLARFLPADASEGTRAYVGGGAQLGAMGLAWNLDSWDGYPAARARMLQTLVDHGTNALILAGDSHNCWVNNLAAEGVEDRLAAIEFAGGSVTSAGFESALTNAQPGEREAAMRGANPVMAWCDVTHRGYGAVTLTRERCDAEWVAFADVKDAANKSASATRLSAEARGNGPSGWAVG